MHALPSQPMVAVCLSTKNNQKSEHRAVAYANAETQLSKRKHSSRADSFESHGMLDDRPASHGKSDPTKRII